MGTSLALDLPSSAMSSLSSPFEVYSPMTFGSSTGATLNPNGTITGAASAAVSGGGMSGMLFAGALIAAAIYFRR